MIKVAKLLVLTSFAMAIIIPRLVRAEHQRNR